MSALTDGRPARHRRIEIPSRGTNSQLGVNPRNAVGRASRPNPSANPVGGCGRRSSSPVTLRITRNHRTRLKQGLFAVIGGLALALGATGQANAGPTPAEIEAQIDAQWNQLEPVLEQYNKADPEFQANQAKANQLAQQIRPLALQVDVALSRVSDIAVQYYMSGRASAFSALLTSGNSATFADQLITLNGIAQKEEYQIKDVVELKNKYDAE